LRVGIGVGNLELIDHVVEETDACGDWMGALCEVEAKL
jgi:hypothetical protein